MSHKKLSQSLNEFVNTLVEEELEPIRLDLIRIENDLRSELDEIIDNKRQKTLDEISRIVDERYDILKNAIENLATRASEAFAEGFSEQEEQYMAICEKLSDRISMLEKRLGV